MIKYKCSAEKKVQNSGFLSGIFLWEVCSLNPKTRLLIQCVFTGFCSTDAISM